MTALRSARHAFRHLWESINAKNAEWGSALITFGLGYTILLPGERIAYSPSFAVILAYFGAPAIGWAILFGGAGRLLVLGINGAWNSSPYARAAAAACTSLLWLILFAGFLVAMGWSAPGTWFYLTLALSDFVNVSRSMRDAAASVYLKKGVMIRREDGSLAIVRHGK